MDPKPNLKQALRIGRLAAWPPETVSLAHELEASMPRDLSAPEWIAMLDGHAAVFRRRKDTKGSGTFPRLLGRKPENGDG
jgi:hypothetical protein